MRTEQKVKKYFEESFSSDLKAGLITAVVALPLAIAFAIASGVEPVMGLYTAIIAGMLISTFGGSRYSVSGPTGAMTVIVLSTVNGHGVEGLLLAGFLAGVFQILFGIFRLGKVVKYIPLPVISGFTSGIGIIILIGQLSNVFGLVLPAREHVWETIYDVFTGIDMMNILALSMFAGTIILMLLLPKVLSNIRYLKNVPASIITLVLSVILTYRFDLEIPIVGEIPSTIPQIHMLDMNIGLMYAVLPAAFTIALLGTIESLLCAVVCDAMTNTKHNSNKELIGQGIANVILPFFAGIPATAAIARSAVNIREGAKTRMSGVIHALVLFGILIFFGPIAQYIPKAYLAGILVLVSIKMVNVDEIRTTMNISKMDTFVLLTTLALTVLTDLVFAIQAGMFLSIILLFIRLTNIIEVQSMESYDPSEGINATILADPYLKDNVAVYTINGPFFFGAMAVFENKVDEHIHMSKPHIIIRMRYVPFIDTTGIERLKSFIITRKGTGEKVYLTTVQPEVMRSISSDAVLNKLIQDKDVTIFKSTQEALGYLQKRDGNR
ncbi:SulP family inorganic anion transporter [Methanococcoides alaskense]|uniref:SulP family sulfate permease n=1 Tax=Methanococcoides alaskense TaxID=325778 RepID=A0AA90TYQ3_9EURY|nr:SulP family inorganic anion transporter [Methanococcoides alaskense]MDA0524117.1 SulP family inorganic anion transporter [Methanococcoides alaskense]MDR6222570.1 SulP family sulfate permease [Methanococcoides alaskense]